ncbi:MAG: TetR/AcrR family transcriptional regulator [Actinomycetota bacterium]|nr:TetR/AcrR family transcriptional regulator [Actinomycetota bacterium]
MNSAEPVRDRLVEAAFALFEQRGFEGTSVGDIATKAGVGRTTLFRHFGSKEALIFPNHDELLGRATERLALAGRDTMPGAVLEVASAVFDQYLAEGERARIRYRLTRTVPALRQYEIATVARYAALFASQLNRVSPQGTQSALRNELFANAVVVAHNHVLRRWLRDEVMEPRQELADALAATRVLLRGGDDEGGPARTTVVCLSTDEPLDSLLPRLHRAVEGG